MGLLIHYNVPINPANDNNRVLTVCRYTQINNFNFFEVSRRFPAVSALQVVGMNYPTVVLAAGTAGIASSGILKS